MADIERGRLKGVVGRAGHTGRSMLRPYEEGGRRDFRLAAYRARVGVGESKASLARLNWRSDAVAAAIARRSAQPPLKTKNSSQQ
jgi:hypothetical protein